jgi:hypothetical protein
VLVSAFGLALAVGLNPMKPAVAQAGNSAGKRRPAGGWEEIPWDDLMPPDWDPLKDLGVTDLGSISDGDPRAEALMQKLRDVLDKAPTRPELDGRKVRLPGYVVPLDGMLGGNLKEFLLVPYFGACIHSPPPPANQIILVRSGRGRSLETMDAVWVNGTLRVARSDSRMGISGYALDAVSVEPYTAPPPQ